jgi:hypothetical protein
MLVIVGRILALLPPSMLRPALAFVLTLTCLPMVFLTAGTTTVPVPVGVLNGDMLSDRWN